MMIMEPGCLYQVKKESPWVRCDRRITAPGDFLESGELAVALPNSMPVDSGKEQYDQPILCRFGMGWIRLNAYNDWRVVWRKVK